MSSNSDLDVSEADLPVYSAGQNMTVEEDETTARSTLRDVLAREFFPNRNKSKVPKVPRRFAFKMKPAAQDKNGVDLPQLFEDAGSSAEDFRQVVDQDDAHTERYISQYLVGGMIDSFIFKTIVFILIILNAIVVGIQTDYDLAVKYQREFLIFEEIIMAAFIIEILLKWYHGFVVFWRSGWNILDFVIVAAILILPQFNFLSSARTLRILRLLRALRTLKGISILQGMGTVVQTTLQSIPDVLNIVLLLLLVFLVLGVFGTYAFSVSVPLYFADMYDAVYSLFICMTQDGWVTILSLFRLEGGFIYALGVLFLFSSIVICAFIFSNLIVAVLVTNLQLALRDRRKVSDSTDTSGYLSKCCQEKKPESAAIEDDAIPLIDFREIKPNIDLQGQLPVEKTDLRNLSTEKVEKYLYLLTVLESNLKEYDLIKSDLQKILGIVTQLNSVPVDPNAYAKWLANRETAQRNAAAGDIDLNKILKGDIMSNLMKLEQRRGTDESTSKGVKTENMSEIIKSSVDPASETRATRSKSSPMKKRMSAIRSGSLRTGSVASSTQGRNSTPDNDRRTPRSPRE